MNEKTPKQRFGRQFAVDAAFTACLFVGLYVVAVNGLGFIYLIGWAAVIAVPYLIVYYTMGWYPSARKAQSGTSELAAADGSCDATASAKAGPSIARYQASRTLSLIGVLAGLAVAVALVAFLKFPPITFLAVLGLEVALALGWWVSLRRQREMASAQV